MDNEFDPLELDDFSESSLENAEKSVLDIGFTKDVSEHFDDQEAEDFELQSEPAEVSVKNETVLVPEEDFQSDELDQSTDYVPSDRRRTVYGGMWGQNEIVAVGAGALAILAMLVIVFFWVYPAQNELSRNKIQQDQLEAELISAKGKYGSITDTETQVAKLISSVNDFESRFLPSEYSGKSALYERLNGLIAGYGLINSNGPEFAPLEILDPQRRQQQENERGRDKLISLFPGMFVTVTVEGPYQNIRRFIREIETSQQFIMVSTVELVPADKQKEKKTDIEAQKIAESGQIPADNNDKLESVYRGKTHGETVSLKIEMAAYFRRSNYTPLVTEVR